MRQTWFHRIAFGALLLTFVVVVLGAFTRLADAGLGCPDWPGCYGFLTAPQQAEQIQQAEQAFPGWTVETHKAWIEMIHRYAAGILGLAILFLAIVSWRHRRLPEQPVGVPLALLGLVIFQSLLGMWTVTMLLKPAIVLAHLLGGMTILGLLGWLVLRHGHYLAPPQRPPFPRLRLAALIGVAVVAVQIALGGWTSTNYAALACPDFPLCQGQWWPPADFGQGFVLWRELGVNYEGGVLDGEARVGIHMAHRIGAVVTALYVGALAFALAWRGHFPQVRLAGGILAGALVFQLLVGIYTVLWQLPLWLATVHNAGAALLLLAMLLVNHVLRTRNTSPAAGG